MSGPFIPTGREFDEASLPALQRRTGGEPIGLPRSRRPPDHDFVLETRKQDDLAAAVVKDPTPGWSPVDVVAVFAGRSRAVDQVCAAVRWLAPHLDAAPSDELVLAALELAELLSAEAEALWLWHVAQRRPDVVVAEAYEACSALPEDFRKVLTWVVAAGPVGLHTYADAAAAAEPYLRALREMERAARSYAVLQEVVRAVRAGVVDPNRVMSQLPGSWSAPALQQGRKSQIVKLFNLRDRAARKGVDADFPALRAPRFSAVAEPQRSLCKDLISGLPGVAGTRLDQQQPVELSLDHVHSRGDRAVLSQRLRRRGLPVQSVVLDADFWCDAVSDRGAAWVAEIDDDSAGARCLRGLLGFQRQEVGAELWVASVLGPSEYWSPQQQQSVIDRAFDAFVAGGRDESAAALLRALPKSYAEYVEHRLDEGMRSFAAPAVSLLALTDRLQQSLLELLEVEGADA